MKHLYTIHDNEKICVYRFKRGIVTETRSGFLLGVDPLAPTDGVADPDCRFLGLPVSTDYIDGVTWKLNRPVAYRTAGGVLTSVSVGFLTDWASVPRPFRGLFPPAGRKGDPYGVAALFHDCSCRSGQIGGILASRKLIDALFLEIMLYTGVAPTVARVMWAGVRAWAIVTHS